MRQPPSAAQARRAVLTAWLLGGLAGARGDVVPLDT
jgi:hypothetical protein